MRGKFRDQAAHIKGVANLLEISEAEVEHLTATDPHFPKPTVESGVARWWLSEICRWRDMKWVRGRAQFVC